MVEDAKPEPVSMGIIVDFTSRTVQGFGNPVWVDFPVKITGVNEVTISFRGSSRVLEITDWSIDGAIDRVTSDVEATSIQTNVKTIKTMSSMRYVLKCRPTQRMF